MKKTSFILSLLMTVICITVSGCKTKASYAPEVPDGWDTENHSPFVLMNKRVERSVTIAGIQERILEDGRLEVTANILSKDDRRIQVQVSCVFKNENGFPTGDETPWNTLILTENAQEGLIFKSMNTRARKYTIRVREAR